MEFFKFLLIDGLSYLHFIFGNWGLAIIALALGVRILLLPLQVFNFIQQRRLQRIQPEVDHLQRLYQADPLQALRKIGELKKQRGIRTWTVLILSFAQIPIFIGMYQAIVGVKSGLNVSFWWLPSLATPDTFFILPLIVALTAYWQFRNKNAPFGEKNQSADMVGKLLPLLNFAFMVAMPSSLVLYYATSGLFQLASDSVCKSLIA